VFVRPHVAILIAVFLLGLPVAFSQPVSFGVVAGGSLTGDFQSRTVGDLNVYSTPKGWIAGGMLEVRLPLALSIEIDGLYHPLEFTDAVVEPSGQVSSISRSTVVTWEFPVFAKYRFTLPLVKPFVELGPAFRSAGNPSGTSPSHHGLAMGVGVEARAWRLKVAPAVRYVRWARDQNVAPLAPSTAPDQAELLVGVSF
jgi:hypothetical protein